MTRKFDSYNSEKTHFVSKTTHSFKECTVLRKVTPIKLQCNYTTLPCRLPYKDPFFKLLIIHFFSSQEDQDQDPDLVTGRKKQKGL